MLDLPELPRPGHYRGGGHGRVVLGPRAYFESDSVGYERLEIGAGGTGKLVYHCYFDLVHKFTHDRGAELAEQLVDVSGGGPAGLVLRGRERDDVDVVRTQDLEDAARDPG